MMLFGKISLKEQTAMSASDFLSASSIFSIIFDSIRSSLSTKVTKSPEAIFRPAFRAAERPWFF